MLIIALRTLFVYLFLMLLMRLLGKRQVGQMQVEELVSALLLSELAAFPIADQSIPLIYAFLPVAIIVLFELFATCLSSIFPAVNRLLEGAPAILIAGGVLDQKQLIRCRISPDELLAQLRLKDVADLSQVDYAILEQTGQLSVFLKSGENGKNGKLSLPLIVNGAIFRKNLKRFSLTVPALKRHLAGVPIKNVLLYAENEDGKSVLIEKDREAQEDNHKI